MVPWPEFRGLRDARMTYVEYLTGDMEDYGNQADPYQLANLIRALPAPARCTPRRSGCPPATARAAVPPRTADHGLPAADRPACPPRTNPCHGPIMAGC